MKLGNRHIDCYVTNDGPMGLLMLVGSDGRSGTINHDLNLSDFKVGERLIIVTKRDLDRMWDLISDLEKKAAK